MTHGEDRVQGEREIWRPRVCSSDPLGYIPSSTYGSGNMDKNGSKYRIRTLSINHDGVAGHENGRGLSGAVSKSFFAMSQT